MRGYFIGRMKPSQGLEPGSIPGLRIFVHRREQVRSEARNCTSRVNQR